MIEDSNIKVKAINFARGIIPTSIFGLLRPAYHYLISALSAIYYGYPSRKLKVLAVTGTKGKSTTTFMLAQVLRGLGEKTASIGSLGYSINEKSWPNKLKMTMPGRGKIHKFLRQALDAGCDWCVLETTSEGIEQFRLVGVDIFGAVFTNLHPEHIESHGSMENYKNAKLKLFAKKANIHVLNFEDPYFSDFALFCPPITITYGAKNGMLTFNDVPNLNLRVAGDFNKLNALAVVSMCVALGFDKDRVVEILNNISEIPGRMQTINLRNGAVAIVDYAHTPDSLDAVYRNARQMVGEDAKLITVLGSAGGGRDIWKRPIFGKIAQSYADKIILTDEDPFEEDPSKIIDDIKQGFNMNLKLDYEVIMDREQAILQACSLAKTGDIVVITGKGSEISMALAGGAKIPWSDSEIVKKFELL